ncbi:Zn-dependent protease with chaperone function [Chitinophaga skermanii]|uniref:Zn-dependent protease with chaperone function n=1 Tax=Chitinophaga skermanii TaxID=331697 RepID=A0A327QK41_9BACT|nr:M48 family metallopeptidase [Chitinophaga skermanii]RAJ04245.1 Zn-dependent protease with chaperone function [Chitinophaga skermanii]
MFNTTFYPPNPSHVDAGLTEPSKAFKSQVTKVIFAISLFFFVFLLMISLSVVLVGLCVYAGVAILLMARGALFLILGAAVICLGLFVLFFLLKFIFAKTKTHNPLRVQIYEEQHPQLFGFIRQLAADTNVPMPKKVFLVPDINAAVFYDSSFWSMFFPVRKNLEIGLGLVNVLNLSEFKMVVAHEFGHFSQRSMKLGSFTYSVNRVIYNMLYDNTGYNNMLNTVGSIHGLFAVMASVTVWIASGIQAVLRAMYGVINKPYYQLAQEMEFHADAVALSVAGSGPATSAMRRIEAVAYMMNYCTETMADWQDSKAGLTNMFAAQTGVNELWAKRNNIAIEHNYLKISDEMLSNTISSRLKYKDLWATHPPVEEREERYKLANVQVVEDTRSAWILFNNPQAVQEEITKHYTSVNFPNTELTEWRHADQLIAELSAHYEKFSLPNELNGFHDGRTFCNIEPGKESQTPLSFEAIYNDENKQKFKRYFQDIADLNTLHQIEAKQLDVKHFTFDGKRYKASQVKQVIEELEATVKATEDWTIEIDQAAYNFHQQLAKHSSDELANELATRYTEIVDRETNQKNYLQPAANMVYYIREIFGRQLSMEEFQEYITAIKEEDAKMKPALQSLLGEQLPGVCNNPVVIDNYNRYLTAEFTFISGEKVLTDELICMYNVCVQMNYYISRITDLKKKQYFETVVALL